MTKSHSTTDQIKRELSTINKLLDDAMFIGMYSNAQKEVLKQIATSNGLESALHAKQLIVSSLDLLRSEFDQLAKDGMLQELRLANPERFNTLWKAKFMKEPTL